MKTNIGRLIWSIAGFCVGVFLMVLWDGTKNPQEAIGLFITVLASVVGFALMLGLFFLGAVVAYGKVSGEPRVRELLGMGE